MWFCVCGVFLSMFEPLFYSLSLHGPAVQLQTYNKFDLLFFPPRFLPLPYVLPLECPPRCHLRTLLICQTDSESFSPYPPQSVFSTPYAASHTGQLVRSRPHFICSFHVCPPQIYALIAFTFGYPRFSPTRFKAFFFRARCFTFVKVHMLFPPQLLYLLLTQTTSPSPGAIRWIGFFRRFVEHSYFLSGSIGSGACQLHSGTHIFSKAPIPLRPP